MSSSISSVRSRAEQATRWAPADLGASPGGPSHGDTGPAVPAPVTQESIRSQAYSEGLAEGRAQGIAEERARLAALASALEGAVSAVEEARPEWMHTLERNLHTLALAVARQVIGRELTADAEAVAERVASALNRFPIDESLTIRMNPADLSVLSAESLEGRRDPAVGRDVRWRPDPNVERGSCVVEGPERLVDGRIDKALLRIYHALGQP